MRVADAAGFLVSGVFVSLRNCQVAEETAVKIDSAREGYRSAAIRASVAYFVLDDLSRVDPMYQVRRCSLAAKLHVAPREVFCCALKR